MSLEEKENSPITMEEGAEEEIEKEIEEEIEGKEKSKLKDNLSFLSNRLSSIDEGSFFLLFRIGLGFAIVAIIISFIVGILSGISFLTVLLRILFVGFIFLLLGFGIALFLKYFVPDVFALFLSSSLEGEDSVDTNEDGIVGSNLDYIIEENSMDDDLSNTTEEAEEDLYDDKELKEDVSLLGDATGINKNVNLKDFNIPKEPEILAQAVKTAISKDS